MAESSVVSSFKRSNHNHRRCIDDALRIAEALCAERGVRLTVIRRRVLEMIWERHEPVLAYDLLAQLRNEQPRAAPPTVYRALGFLQQQGLVHRIESLNAYVGCANPARSHSGQFLICSECRSVAELDDNAIDELIAERARAAGFETDTQTIEVRGRCPACRATSASQRRARR